jgi:hypothetical protein
MNADELQHRIKNAIILLADGHTFEVGNLTFGCKDKNHLSVTGWTLKNDLVNVTKQSALSELADIKTLFNNMNIASNELADFIKNRQIEYCLGFDYGMGAVGICKETNGHLTWEADLKD